VVPQTSQDAVEPADARRRPGTIISVIAML
jgi:hypothetical protein